MRWGALGKAGLGDGNLKYAKGEVIIHLSIGFLSLEKSGLEIQNLGHMTSVQTSWVFTLSA